jgi:hypothetical protein
VKIICRGLKQKVMNPNKGYIVMGQKVVAVTVKLKQPHRIATLFRCILSAVVKSLSRR